MADQKPSSETDGSVESTAESVRRPLSKRSRLAAIGATVLVLCGTLAWFLTNDNAERPHEVQQLALELLQDRESLAARNQARVMAEKLRELEFRDTEFPGAIEYILGIAVFRDAEELGEVGREQRYRLAARYLEQARVNAVSEPELSYALGISLFQLGRPSAARERLEEAIDTFPDGRVRASLKLQEIYLDSKADSLLERAEQLNQDLLDKEPLTAAQRDDVYLQRAHILMALGRDAEAMGTLANLTEKSQRKQSTQVFHAQVLMTKADRLLAELRLVAPQIRATAEFRQRLQAAQQDYVQAAELLKPVADAFGLERPQARRASFLTAVCQERVGDTHAAMLEGSTRKNYDAAIAAYERTAEKYETSHEGVAANLRAADLLRREERHEEALKAYKRAMESVRRPEDFSNRWLTLDDFRDVIGTAWQDWLDLHLYETAIELSKRMVPLFPRDAAKRYSARANQAWSEYLEQKLQGTPFKDREPLERELRERWRLSGRAHAELAYELRTSDEYPDVLWTSAMHFRNGHDFEQALNQLIAFIGTRPKERLPVALVRLGEVLLDSDRPAEALEQFEKVSEEYPTELAAFEARYLRGIANLELDRLDEAAAAWSDILTSSELTPAAREWRQSLLSLGRLLYHRAGIFSIQVQKQDDSTTADVRPLDQLFTMWDAAARRLEEFLKRYPDDADAREARYLLAKSLQSSADVPRQKLRTAETENASQELRRTMHGLLEEAKREFLTLQAELIELEHVDMLDPLGQRMLRECSFEIAHTYFALGLFEEAIVRYGGAANRFPDDPHVLLAYVQMSNCNDRLGKPDEARSMLEQARIIHKGMADDVFRGHMTGISKQEWGGWIEWARRLHQTRADEQLLAQER